MVTHGTVMSLYIAAELGVDAALIWKQLATPCHAVLGGPRHEPFAGIQYLDS